MVGDYLRETSDDEWDDFKDTDAGFRFRPKRKNTKVAVTDILRELFDYGMEGNVYAIILKVPDEYPVEDLTDEYVDVYDSRPAAKILANWENLKLIDRNGKEIK